MHATAKTECCNVFCRVLRAYDWLTGGLQSLYGRSTVNGRGFSKAAVVQQ
jgi:hypothetical protein